MSKYTINDVKHIIPVEQTQNVKEAIEEYLNNGTIPPYDPCQSCEPNHIRKLISAIQVAERNGLFPPKREEQEPKEVDWAEGGYVAGIISKEELDSIKEKRAPMFEDGADWSEETLAEAEDQD